VQLIKNKVRWRSRQTGTI